MDLDKDIDGPEARARQIDSCHSLAVWRFGDSGKDRSKAGNEGQEARRHHACGQEASVIGDEETLGRAAQKLVLARNDRKAQLRLIHAGPAKLESGNFDEETNDIVRW